MMVKICVIFNLVNVPMSAPRSAALTSLNHFPPSSVSVIFFLAWIFQPHRISVEEFLMSPTLFKTQSFLLLIDSTSQLHHITCSCFGGVTLGSRSKIVSGVNMSSSNSMESKAKKRPGGTGGYLLTWPWLIFDS